MKRLEVKRYRLHVLVCRGKRCLEAGGDEVGKALRRELRARGAEVRLSRSLCLGQCSKSCVVVAEGPKRARWWGRVRPKAVGKLAAKIAKLAKAA